MIHVDKHKAKTTNDHPSDQIKDQLKSKLDSGVEKAKHESLQAIEDRKTQAASQIDDVADVAHSIADTVSEKNLPEVSRYIETIATQIDNFASSVRKRPVEQLWSETQALARNNPKAFVAGGVLLGMGLMRFLKAAKPEQSHSNDESQSAATSVSDSYNSTYSSTSATRHDGSVDRKNASDAAAQNPTSNTYSASSSTSTGSGLNSTSRTSMHASTSNDALADGSERIPGWVTSDESATSADLTNEASTPKTSIRKKTNY